VNPGGPPAHAAPLVLLFCQGLVVGLGRVAASAGPVRENQSLSVGRDLRHRPRKSNFLNGGHFRIRQAIPKRWPRRSNHGNYGRGPLD